MSKLSFSILPSPETNDHEIRILIDGEDFLGDDYLGLDPPAFLCQENFDKNGQLRIGRCTCGCDGCCDYPITVTVIEEIIRWSNDEGINLTFDKHEYDQAIHIAKADNGWEDIKRKVERLTTNILKNSSTVVNYEFEWASARIKDNHITLSFIIR